MLTSIACISVFVAVIVAMVGIGFIKPDKGNIVAVQDNMSVVTGLTPVMNIVLAYGMSFYISNIKSVLTMRSRPCGLF
jgi:hypothetical protein